jgi:cytochrome c oxidase assembly factor CtaG
VFQADPLLALPLLGVGALYAIGYRRLTARGFHGARPLIFGLGYLTLVIALVSPLHTLGETSFALHMTQHLLLTLMAPPLLLLSRSMPVLLWGLPSEERATLGRLVGRPGPVRGVLRGLTLPLVAFWLFIVTQWMWHQPLLYDWALDNRWAHYAEHLSFFGTGLLFWWPVIGAPPLPSPLSYPGRMLYTFLAWMPNTFLGAGLTLSTSALYHYTYEDQQLAGLLMWMPGDVLFASVLLLLLVAFLNHEQRTAERLERELDRRAS